MELTGKCKELFEKWFEEKYDNNNTSKVIMLQSEFNIIPFEMKFGVYVDFFDYLQMQIYIKPTMSHKWSVYIDDFGHHILTDYLTAETRQEARTEAIKKANEIINKN